MFLSHFSSLTPDKPAIICKGQVLSYAELWERVQERSRQLRDEGLREGQPYDFVMSQDVDSIVTYCAVQCCGASSILYTTGTTGVGDSFKFCQRTPTQYDTQWVCTPDVVRRVAVTDLKNKKNSLTPSPAGNSTKPFTYDFADKTATLPLTIFGKYSSAAATTIDGCPNARIYSVRFYENYVEGGDNTPVRELVPYSRDGVVGFYDTVTGEIVKNDNAAAGAFTFGGAGTDHGALNCYLTPGYGTTVAKGASQTTSLTAYAPGAVSYRWYRDGQLVDDDNDGIADGADGVLPVKWVRGGVRTDTGFLHAYQAKAVFNLYGVTREGEPTAEAQVTSLYLGTTLILR